MSYVICHDPENGLAVLVDIDRLEAHPCVFGGPEAAAMAGSVLDVISKVDGEMGQALVWHAYIDVVGSWEAAQTVMEVDGEAAVSDPPAPVGHLDAEPMAEAASALGDAHDAAVSALEDEEMEAREPEEATTPYTPLLAMVVNRGTGDILEHVYSEKRLEYLVDNAPGLPGEWEIIVGGQSEPVVTGTPEPVAVVASVPAGAEQCSACKGSGSTSLGKCVACDGRGYWAA